VIHFGLTLTTPPGEEPVSLSEAKTWCRITHSYDDDQVAEAISAARELCEAWTRRQFVTATWKMVMDRFDGSGYLSWRAGAHLPIPQTKGSGFDKLVVRVPLPPLASMSSVKYVDTDGVLTTLAADQYRVDALTGSSPRSPRTSTGSTRCPSRGG
jgi:hypothetical protein